MQIHTRILFDSGSQRFYISETVWNKLKLKTVRTERVIINTFGQTGGSEVRKLDVVQFNVKHRTDSLFTTIDALCVPTVCSPLTNQYISSVHDLDEFRGLGFADYEGNTTNLAIGVLVGIDFYHNLITGITLRSKAGPMACGSKLGYVLQGHRSSP